MSVSSYASHVQNKAVTQGQPIPFSNQVQNSDGAFVWQVDCWTRLERFLILGNQGGSYYASEKKLTVEAATAVLECFALDPKRTVDMIVRISVEGLAPKNDPAIFALAMLSEHSIAREAIPKVCRIGTHLFQYVNAVQQMRGWGSGLARSVAAWYGQKTADQLAYQVTKYQNREGWSHHDVLHMCHAKPTTDAHNAVYRWVKDGTLSEASPELLFVMEQVKVADVDRLCQLIEKYKLAREVIPTEHLNNARVWAYLLPHMPMGAMIRNLGKMSAVGLMTPNSQASAFVAQKLSDAQAIQDSRLHPLAILLAGKVYEQGKGIKGSLNWTPSSPVVAALDLAFYHAFKNVQPSNKRFLLGIDVSDSMTWNGLAGTPVTPREAAGAMAMVTVRTEPMVETCAFSHTFSKLTLYKSMGLNDVLQTIARTPMGSTNCAAPMEYALKHKIPVDVFVVYTDSETNSYGSLQPAAMLHKYRDAMGIPAKLIVCAMEANRFTIADPNDPGMLDVVGFSADVPAVMRSFIG